MIAIVLLIVGLLAGSGIGYLAAPRPAAQETLAVIGPWAGAEMQAFLPILDKFQKNTGITVSYSNVRQEDLRPLLLTQFPAHRAPADLIFMFLPSSGSTGQPVTPSTSRISSIPRTSPSERLRARSF